eukprot:c22685_g1_i1 orf=266-1843(+)
MAASFQAASALSLSFFMPLSSHLSPQKRCNNTAAPSLTLAFLRLRSCVSSSSSSSLNFPVMSLPVSASTSVLSRSPPYFPTCSFGQRMLVWTSGTSNYVLRIKVIAEVMEGKGTGLKVAYAAPPRAAAVVESSALPEATASHSETFRNVTSEQELLLGIKKEINEKRIPPEEGYGMEELYYSYRNAVLGSGMLYDKEMIIQIMAMVLDRILLQFEEPFIFPPYHRAIREPFDYYAFGQNYIRPLVDFRNSYLGNLCQFAEIERQLKENHNVILFSNHQTEADPAVMALLLESNYPSLAEDMTYIAGDRVVLDPFCKPFSMGRNLLCVHSKKHIRDVPEMEEMKRKGNIRSLKELALLLRKGGQLIWIAPSGGRDRPDPVTEEWLPAAFDFATLDNMRRLTEQAFNPGHMYPCALLSYGIMPPPREVLKEIGEKRTVGFNGVGMSVGEEINYKKIMSNASNPKEATKFFTDAVWKQVNEHYRMLMAAVNGGEGLSALNHRVLLSQPWSATSNVQCNGKQSWHCHPV